jgi:hypothetical protein
MDEAERAVSVVLVLADEVREHLERGERAGKGVVLPGPAGRARVVLADVEHCLRDPAERGVTATAARWHQLAEQLRAIE